MSPESLSSQQRSTCPKQAKSHTRKGSSTNRGTSVPGRMFRLNEIDPEMQPRTANLPSESSAQIHLREYLPPEDLTCLFLTTTMYGRLVGTSSAHLSFVTPMAIVHSGELVVDAMLRFGVKGDLSIKLSLCFYGILCVTTSCVRGLKVFVEDSN